jgi:hypothetical protein
LVAIDDQGIQLKKPLVIRLGRILDDRHSIAESSLAQAVKRDLPKVSEGRPVSLWDSGWRHATPRITVPEFSGNTRANARMFAAATRG